MTYTRSLTILNERGDQTLVWDESRDDAMAEIIAKKMAQGIRFFVIEPQLGGLTAPKLSPLTDPAQAMRHRALNIPDDDFARFVGEGGADIVKTPAGDIGTPKLERDAKKVARKRSVAVKPMAGG